MDSQNTRTDFPISILDFTGFVILLIVKLLIRSEIQKLKVLKSVLGSLCLVFILKKNNKN